MPKVELIHSAILQQMGDTLPDSIGMFGLRASAAGQTHLHLAREKHTDVVPALRPSGHVYSRPALAVIAPLCVSTGERAGRGGYLREYRN